MRDRSVRDPLWGRRIDINSGALVATCRPCVNRIGLKARSDGSSGSNFLWPIAPIVSVGSTQASGPPRLPSARREGQADSPSPYGWNWKPQGSFRNRTCPMGGYISCHPHSGKGCTTPVPGHSPASEPVGRPPALLRKALDGKKLVGRVSNGACAPWRTSLR